MFVIIGGTGNVGGAVARTLLDAGQPVTIVTRDAEKAADWRERGAELAEADVRDVDALRDVLQGGERAFLLNPPADPSTDTDAVERGTVGDLIAALDGSGLEMVVAQSTGGTRPGGACGDLNVLYQMERKLGDQPLPARIVRAGYHYANWMPSLDMARQSGVIETPLPLDRPLPMVAPVDVGRVCAELLTGEVGSSTAAVEGPRRISARDAIAAIGSHLEQDIEARGVPRDDLEGWFRNAGFSEPAARSYACMTRTLWDDDLDEDVPVLHGTTTFDEYLQSTALNGQTTQQQGVSV